jgi:cold shock CspA family protein
MEDIFYNILWLDDEHESLSSTKGRAKSNGINLIGFKSLNSGMSELERNLHFYDGILLDAKFYENEDDIAGSEDTDNVHRAKERLLQLNKKFEIFVYTGQAEAFEDKTFNKAFKRVYKKGSSDERDRLFNDIKLAAATQEDTQIRHSYKRVFDLCTEKYIGEVAGQDILQLLKVNDEINIENHFNAIRKVVEDLFLAFNKFNLLPAEFVTSGVALNESSKFLAGKGSDGSFFSEKGYQHLEETHLPKQIAFYLRSILSVTQAGSHRSEIDSYVKTIKTSFLLKSVFFQLLDVLAWFKMYVDSNPKTKNWAKVESTTEVRETDAALIQGKIININLQKGFAFFKPDDKSENVFIPPHLIANHELNEGIPIVVEVENYIDNRTNETKKRVKTLEII